MARPTANLRLFAAIYPPPDLAQMMLDQLNGQRLPAHRATPVEQVHMTVQFIGDTPSAELDAVMKSVERAAAGLKPFDLAATHLISLPEHGPARLVAVETDSHSTLLEIHRRLVTRLARNARDADADRFRPHMTLCRFRSPARGVRVQLQLALPPFAVTRLCLMRSTLNPSGALHHEVSAFELKP